MPLSNWLEKELPSEGLGAPDAVAAAYLAMSNVYRPKAPADDFGNIPASYDLRDPTLLVQEAHRAAEEFEVADSTCDHRIHGCVNADRAGVIYLVLRAAELLCGGHSSELAALKLIRLAVREMVQRSGEADQT